MSSIFLGTKKGEKRGVPSPVAYSVTWSSKVPMPPLPEPHITPISFLSSSGKEEKSICPLLTASAADATAYWENRSYLRRSFLSKYFSPLKFFTSQANLVLNFEASNFVIGPAALLPATILSQNSWTELPRGVTAPMPVITTLFM